MRYIPHTYQEEATEHILRHPSCALFLEMGLGKTVATLTAVDRLMHDEFSVDKVLVIAPKSVALNTWTGEASKWDHLRHLRVSVVMGTLTQRRKALKASADIYVINRENVAWLAKEYQKSRVSHWPFDMVIIDESTSFKSHSSERFKALKSVRLCIRRLVELTGTPDPNGLLDLWAPIYLLDGGERLGKNITSYRAMYFRPGRGNGQVVYEWVPRPDAQPVITEKISDICLSMKASDYLTLPDVIDGGGSLILPEMAAYRKFERDALMTIDGADVEALSAAALSNKLLQFSGGAVYDSEAEHQWHEVSNAKIERLQDIIESAQGEPVLVFYQFRHELERMITALSSYKPMQFSGQPDILDAWNAGMIRVMLCHPASVAYGLNMQAGGHIIVWYTPTWNLELYEQANARLHRQGQQKPVIIYHLIAEGTMDARVMKALQNKSAGQNALMNEIKDMRRTLK